MNPGHRLQISPRYINFFPPRRPEGPNKDHLGVLAVASYYRGSETRARIGTAVAVLLLASIYADFAIPLEFELDKRGRKTDQPIPLDLTSTRFLGKMVLVVPLLAALAAHLAEPGLLTTDKAKKNQ